MSTLIDCADTLNCATLSGSDNVNVAFQAGVPNKIVVSLSQSVVGLSNLEVTGNAIISNNSSNAALRITQTGAGEAIRVEDSANPDSTPFVVSSVGNVGIGTSSPSEKLEVVNTTGFSTIKVTANTTLNTLDEASVRLYSGLSSHTRIFHRENGTNFGIYHSNSAGAATKFRINDSGMSLMEGDGNVGVGVQTPAQKLDIRGGTEVNAQVYADSAGATRADLRLRVNNTTGDNYITFGDSSTFDIGRIQYNHNSDYMAFYTNASEQVRLTSNGNLGIGISFPTTMLDVSGAITLRGSRIYHNTSSYVTEFGPGAGTGDSDFYGFYTPSGKATAIYANAGNSSIILSGTNVGIGTLLPSYKLDVNGTARFAGNVEITGTLKAVTQLTASSISSSTNITTGKIYFAPSTTSFDSYLCIKNSNGEIVRETSDERLKENVTYLDNNELLNIALNLKPAKFSWKERQKEDDVDVGFIAQDVLPIYPHAVGEEYQGYYGFKIMKIIPVAIGAIKQLKQENDDLKSRLDDVLKRLSLLENK